MRIAEHPDEHALVERFAVATQQVARLASHVAGQHGRVGSAGEDVHRAAHEIERFVPRKALATGADAVARDVHGLRPALLRRGRSRGLDRGCRRDWCFGARLVGAGLTLAIAPAPTTPATSALLPAPPTRALLPGSAFGRLGRS